MCFNAITCKRQTAKKDIVCYKVVSVYKDSRNRILKSKIYSVIRGCYYRLNKLNPHVDLIVDALFEIDCGYHSYDSLSTCKTNIDSVEDNGIVKCIIPKGSSYFHDIHNREYVSSQIILKEFIK